MNLELVPDDRYYPSEASVKVTSGTPSRLHLSSKSLPGVLEDIEVPDDPRVDAKKGGIILMKPL